MAHFIINFSKKQIYISGFGNFGLCIAIPLVLYGRTEGDRIDELDTTISMVGKRTGNDSKRKQHFLQHKRITRKPILMDQRAQEGK